MRDLELLKIAFIATPEVEIGLHVAIKSLVEHLSAPAEFHLVLDGFNRERRQRLTTLTAPHACRFHEISDLDFGTVKPFYGQVAPYALFYVPELAGGDVLYLDCDLLILTDVARIFGSQPDLAGAVAITKIADTFKPEALFLSRIRGADSPNWNTGVVLFNHEAWVAGEWRQRCLDFAALHAEDCRTADQTAFNAVVGDLVTELPSNYNRPHWRVESAPADCIIHYLGAPKPWHPFARLLHPGHATYAAWQARTAFADTTSPLNTILRYRRPYARAALNRLRATAPAA